MMLRARIARMNMRAMMVIVIGSIIMITKEKGGARGEGTRGFTGERTS